MNEFECKIERGDYFNAEQKEIKSKIISDLITSMNENVNFYSQKFDPQLFEQLIITVLMTFARETLSEIVSINLKDHKIDEENIINISNNIILEICNVIANETILQIKEKITN